MKTSLITRRELLAHSARLAVVGAAVGAEVLRPLQTEAAAHGFKIGACDWTLNKRTDPAAFEVAKRLGLDGVQVDMGDVKDGLPLRKPELQKKFLVISIGPRFVVIACDCTPIPKYALNKGPTGGSALQCSWISSASRQVSTSISASFQLKASRSRP